MTSIFFLVYVNSFHFAVANKYFLIKTVLQVPKEYLLNTEK